MEDFSQLSIRISVDVFEILEVMLDDLSEEERQIIAAYEFGMFNACAQVLKKHPSDVQGTMIGVLIKSFNYSEIQAVEFTQFLIECTDEEFHPTINAIIHRGIQGFYSYQDGDKNEIYNDLTFIIDTVINGEMED